MSTMIESTVKNKQVSFVIVGTILVILYTVFRNSSWHGGTQLHTVMEVSATLLALMIGISGLIRFYAKSDETLFLFIGAGFLGTGFLDGYHAIVTSEYFASLYPSPPESLIPWSWIASRLYLSVFLFWAFMHWKTQRLNQRILHPKLIYAITIISTVLSFLFFAFVPLPAAYYPEFILSRPEELLPALFFALALYGFYSKGEWKNSKFEYWLVMALIVSFISQTLFMSFSEHLFDYEFDMAHLLKKASYITVLTGIYVSMLESFQKEVFLTNEFKDQKDELESIFNTSLEGIALLEMNTKFIKVNQRYCNLVGYTREEMLQMHSYDLLDKEYLKKSDEVFDLAFKRGFYENYERYCITKDGERRRFRSSIALMPDKKRFLMTTIDNTELYNAFQTIKEQTYTDELTQLHNRKAYNEKIDDLMALYERYGTTFSLIMFDIDFFKSINDTYGHDIGDKVLIRLSSVVKSTTRANDYIYRIGGEEFIVLLGATNLEKANIFAEKLRINVEKNVDTLENRVITISIGISEIQEGDDADSIFKRADDFLYYSKKHGRNRVTYKFD